MTRYNNITRAPMGTSSWAQNRERVNNLPRAILATPWWQWPDEEVTAAVLEFLRTPDPVPASLKTCPWCSTQAGYSKGRFKSHQYDRTKEQCRASGLSEAVVVKVMLGASMRKPISWLLVAPEQSKTGKRTALAAPDGETVLGPLRRCSRGRITVNELGRVTGYRPGVVEAWMDGTELAPVGAVIRWAVFVGQPVAVRSELGDMRVLSTADLRSALHTTRTSLGITSGEAAYRIGIDRSSLRLREAPERTQKSTLHITLPQAIHWARGVKADLGLMRGVENAGPPQAQRTDV